MNKSKAILEHQSDVVNAMSDILAKRFFKFATQEDMDELLMGLSKSVGYLALVNTSINKSFKQEKRLKALEEKLENSPLNMTMFEDAPLQQYR